MTITPTLFWTVLIIFGVITVGLLYFVMNLLQQVEKYEDIVEEQSEVQEEEEPLTEDATQFQG